METPPRDVVTRLYPAEGRCSLRTFVTIVFTVATVAMSLVSCSADGDRVDAAADRAQGVTTTTTTTTVAPTTAVPTTTTPPCPTPTAALASGQFTIEVDGTAREYLLALPERFDPNTPVKVILNFHGSGSDMNEQAAYSAFPTDATARGYVVVTPNGTGKPRGWSLAGPGTDDAFVDALLATVRAGACVAPYATFATGISNGSAYSALMGCRKPDVIAAVGMVAATLPSLCPVDHPMPTMAFHGTADPIVPYGGGAVTDRSDGTEAPGAEGSAAQWAERNGCDATPVETKVGADVTKRTWTGCIGDASVTFFSVDGGGHTWPGGIDLAAIGITHLGSTTQTVSATAELLDFFDQVAKNSG